MYEAESMDSPPIVRLDKGSITGAAGLVQTPISSGSLKRGNTVRQTMTTFKICSIGEVQILYRWTDNPSGR